MTDSKNNAHRENLEHIRRAAKKAIHRGAITEDYTLDVTAACKLLNRALATEILCVLRYRHHELTAKGLNSSEIAQEFAEHASSEESHARLIAERINQLGGDPSLDPTQIATDSASEYGTASELMDMVREDLVAERVVIELYRSMILWFGSHDPTTRRMLEDILADEEEHATDLADLLATQGKQPALHEVGREKAS